MEKTPLQYDLEKYEHELESLQSLLDVINQRDVRIFDVLLWIGKRNRVIQQKIDMCKKIIDESEKEDGKTN